MREIGRPRGLKPGGYAQYTDGSPVVHGPFGGDDYSPVEQRMIRRARERYRDEYQEWLRLPWYKRTALTLIGRRVKSPWERIMHGG